MSESNRLNGFIEWTELEFVERERTPREIIKTGIQFRLAGLSISNTKQYLEKLGVNGVEQQSKIKFKRPIYSQLTV